MPLSHVRKCAAQGEKNSFFRAIGAAARSHLASLITFAVAVGGASAAATLDQPVTCALILFFGVVAIAGLQGTVKGLLVALAASAIYSFFLREPALSFALTSADDLVPIIAFNLSAFASSIFAGRLQDRVSAAQTANRRTDALLKISTSLHSAVTLEDLVAALESFTGRPAELYIDGFSGITRLEHRGLAERLLTQNESSSARGSVRGYKFVTPSGAACVAVIDVAQGDHFDADEDVDAVVALLSVTVERCLLLKRLRQQRPRELRVLTNGTSAG